VAVIVAHYRLALESWAQGTHPTWAGAEGANGLGAQIHEDQSPPWAVGVYAPNFPTAQSPRAVNTPIDVTHRPVLGNRRYGTFLEDYYFRVHVQPGVLSLGNLLSNQSRQVEVWNAHFEPKLLSSVDRLNVDGVDVAEPAPAPTTFNQLESRTYTVSISTIGAPVIDGSITFVFPDESPALVITGRRVVVWPFIPQTRHRESLGWLTDVMRAYSAEQRVALRAAPRQSLGYEFQLDNYQFSRAKAISTQWSHRVYGVPVWSELTRLGAVPAGTTVLSFDTTSADYRADDIILVWESDLKYSAVETLALTTSSVELKLPLDQSFTNALVMPLRFGRTLNGSDFARSASDITLGRVTFLVTNNQDLAGDSPFPQYRGLDVVTDRSVMADSMRERIVRSQDVFDNGSGPIEVDPEFSYADRTEMLTFDTQTRAERWRLRKWLHARRGRQRTFWLPSWNNDLEILENVGSAATSLIVRPIGYGLYYGIQDIMLVLADGSAYFNRVLSGSADPGGNDILALSASFGVDFTAAEVALCCFMKHCRLDTDNVTITHGYAGRATASMPVVEVPEGT
jgi:hypothetical protein